MTKFDAPLRASSKSSKPIDNVMLIFSKRTINFWCCWREIAGETERHKDLKTPSHASRDRQKRSDNSAKEESSFFCFSFFKLQNVYWARSVRFFFVGWSIFKCSPFCYVSLFRSNFNTYWRDVKNVLFFIRPSGRPSE